MSYEQAKETLETACSDAGGEYGESDNRAGCETGSGTIQVVKKSIDNGVRRVTIFTPSADVQAEITRPKSLEFAYLKRKKTIKGLDLSGDEVRLHNDKDEEGY